MQQKFINWFQFTSVPEPLHRTLANTGIKVMMVLSWYTYSIRSLGDNSENGIMSMFRMASAIHSSIYAIQN